ncbi:META domain-containing protein [Marinobacter mobilis]|uniref:Heat shock protein HslJ n=1 Tax=Marinobacter mobilis TaxID=488533 RepID=A0A1H2Q8F4_9GAMM|nr:META domain-containing protein [Marinobacter mobilis]SDW03463.1 Heat shock protein HslJ [Marinobacter mobilis]
MRMPAMMTAAALAAATALSGCSAMNGAVDGSATSAMACGQLNITVSYRGDHARLLVGEEAYSLVQIPAASGARYQGEDHAEIQFWSKGPQAMLSVGNRTWPQCVPRGMIAEPFRARGNEPFWQVAVDGGQLRLTQPDSAETASAGYELVARNAAGQTLVADLDGRPVLLETAPQLCRDSMSGMAYPHQARLTLDGARLEGCAGNPDMLLQGVEWVVEDIDRGGIIDSSRITLHFLPEGRLAGRASCNNYMGSYQLSGEGLSVGQTASTMMACAPSLMHQERRFLEVLGAVQRFDILPTGALILETADGRTLRAFGEQSLNL